MQPQQQQQQELNDSKKPQVGSPDDSNNSHSVSNNVNNNKSLSPSSNPPQSTTNTTIPSSTPQSLTAVISNDQTNNPTNTAEEDEYDLFDAYNAPHFLDDETDKHIAAPRDEITMSFSSDDDGDDNDTTNDSRQIQPQCNDPTSTAPCQTNNNSADLTEQIDQVPDGMEQQIDLHAPNDGVNDAFDADDSKSSAPNSMYVASTNIGIESCQKVITV